jgi:hypothetical protein
MLGWMRDWPLEEWLNRKSGYPVTHLRYGRDGNRSKGPVLRLLRDTGEGSRSSHFSLSERTTIQLLFSSA